MFFFSSRLVFSFFVFFAFCFSSSLFVRADHHHQPSTLLEAIDINHELSILSEVLSKDSHSTIRELLKSTGPLTFFAPTNSAFHDLAKATDSSSTRVADHVTPNQLLYHLTFGSFDSKSLNNLNFVSTALATPPSHSPAVLQITKTEKVKCLTPKAIDRMALPDRPINPQDPLLPPPPANSPPIVPSSPEDLQHYDLPPPSDRDLGRSQREDSGPVINPDNASIGKDTIAHSIQIGELQGNDTKQLVDENAVIPTIFSEHRHRHHQTESREKVHLIKLRLINGIAGVGAFTSSVVEGDIFADNGVLHVIDTVLTPPARTTNMLEVYNDLANRVHAKHDKKVSGVNGFLSMIDEADLWNEIDQPEEPITLFAPTDAALAQVKALDREDLRTFVHRHMLKGRHFTTELVAYTETQTVQQEVQKDEFLTEIEKEIQEKKYAYQVLTTLSKEQIAVYEKKGEQGKDDNKASIERKSLHSSTPADEAVVDVAASELSSTDSSSSLTPLFVNNARLVPYGSNILAANAVIHIIDAPIQTCLSRKEEEKALNKRSEHRKDALAESESDSSHQHSRREAEKEKLEKELLSRPPYEKFYAPYEKFFHPFYNTDAPWGKSIADQEKKSGSKDFFPSHHEGDVDQRVDEKGAKQQAAVASPGGQFGPFDYTSYYRSYLPNQFWSSPRAVFAELAHHGHDHHAHAHGHIEQPEQPQQREQPEQPEQPQQKDWKKWVPEPYRHYAEQQGQQPEQPQQLATLFLAAAPSPRSVDHGRGDDSRSIHRDVSNIIIKGDNARIYGPQAEQPDQSSPDFSRFIRLLEKAAEEKRAKQHSSGSAKDDENLDDVIQYKAYSDGTDSDENFEETEIPDEVGADLIQSTNEIQPQQISTERDTRFIQPAVSVDQLGVNFLSPSTTVWIYVVSALGLIAGCAAVAYAAFRKRKMREHGSERERQSLRGFHHPSVYNSAEVDPVDDSLYRA